MVHKANDNIKEEVFLQVIKQISSKKQIFMRILCCLCYCVKPSTRIYIPLLNYFYEEATIYENVPKEIMNYCFYHMIRSNLLTIKTSIRRGSTHLRFSNYIAHFMQPKYQSFLASQRKKLFSLNHTPQFRSLWLNSLSIITLMLMLNICWKLMDF